MTSPERGWRSGWCGIDRTLDNPSHRRCIGEGPSASKPDGVVKCKCTCHDPKAKKRAAAKQAWKGLK